MSYMRSEERQKQILACAKRVFAERGFHAANVSHICDAAKIGRGTLYLYFANKHAVLTAILRDALSRVTQVMERQSMESRALPPPEQITRSQAIRYIAHQLRDLFRVVFDDDDTIRILLREAVGLDVDAEKLLGEIDHVLISVVERDLVASREAGYTRDLDPRFVATMIVGGLEKLALHALRSREPVDLDALSREAALLHAVGTLSDRLAPED